nr:MFS transporter [Brevibacterium otitidis]
MLLAGPIGVVVDYHNRFAVAIMANVIRVIALIAASLAWLFATDVELWHLIVLSLVLGGVEPLFETSVGAAIPQVVSGSALHKYNSVISFVQTFANGVVGPVLGASLFTLNANLPLLFNSALLVGASLTLLPFLAATPKPVDYQPGDTDDSDRWRKKVLAGLIIIRKNPLLVALLCLTAGWNLIGWMPEGPLAYYVTVEIGASDTAYSWILATTSIGSLVGASLAPLARTAKARVGVLVASTPIYGAAFVLIYFSPNIWVSALIFGLQGLPLMLWAITSTTLRQKLIDNRYLGRVNVVFYSTSIVLGPLGMALGSAFAEVSSARNIFLVAGSLLCALAAAILGWSISPGARATRRALAQALKD